MTTGTHAFQIVAFAWLCSLSSQARPGVALAQESRQTQVISVDDPRPLEQIALALSKRHGLLITYEDPPYHASEGVDVTNLVNRQKTPPERRTVIPRGGPFTFKYQYQPHGDHEQWVAILRQLLREYETTAYPGHFRLVTTGESFHIIPVAYRGPSGGPEPYQALLDTELSFLSSNGKRPAIDALQDLVDAVSGATGIKVVLGAVPSNLLQDAAVPEVSGTRTARAELARVLESTQQRLSWLLLTMPEEPPQFVLNIVVVPIASRASDRTQEP